MILFEYLKQPRFQKGIWKILENFSCCHWNANSGIAQDSQNLSLIKAYNSIYKHDFIWISEMFLNSSILGDSEDAQFRQLKGCKLIRADHPFIFMGMRCFYKLRQIFNCKNSMHIIFNQMYTF